MTAPTTVREGETVRDVPTVYLVVQQGPGPYGYHVVATTTTASVGKAHADDRLSTLRHATVNDWEPDSISPIGRSFSRSVVWERAADGTPTDVGWQSLRPMPLESR